MRVRVYMLNSKTVHCSIATLLFSHFVYVWNSEVVCEVYRNTIKRTCACRMLHNTHSMYTRICTFLKCNLDAVHAKCVCQMCVVCVWHELRSNKCSYNSSCFSSVLNSLFSHENLASIKRKKNTSHNRKLKRILRWRQSSSHHTQCSIQSTSSFIRFACEKVLQIACRSACSTTNIYACMQHLATSE